MFPTCAQPAPVLLPSLQCDPLYEPSSRPIYLLFTIRATNCNTLPEIPREVSIRQLPLLLTSSFFLPTIPQGWAQQEQHREHGSRLTYTDNRQPASFFLPTYLQTKGADSASFVEVAVRTCKSLSQTTSLRLIKVAQC